MRTLHLFAGAGGGLLADLILGHEPVAAVEWDAYCCAVLRERAAEGWFPGLAVHECDVRDFDPTDYAGKVDAIHAGFPCQDISSAGRMDGVGDGTRSGLYREVLRIAGVLRPEYLFLENVAAITGNGLHQVLADLAALGFDARWDCVRASDVGANHRRDRWWCVAYANGSRLEGRHGGVMRERTGERAAGENGSSSDASSIRCEGQRISAEAREGLAHIGGDGGGRKDSSWRGWPPASDQKSLALQWSSGFRGTRFHA